MYTGLDPTQTATVQRRLRDGSRVAVTSPVAVAEYNRCMGGVDRGDQLRGYYAYRIKSRKFYKYIFNFLVGVTLVNSFVLHKIRSPKKLTIKKFQELVAISLIGDYCSRRNCGRISTPVQPLPFLHFPLKGCTGTAQRSRGRCSLCKEREIRADSQWFCNECNVWLCHQGTSNDCFLRWHRRHL